MQKNYCHLAGKYHNTESSSSGDGSVYSAIDWGENVPISKEQLDIDFLLELRTERRFMINQKTRTITKKGFQYPAQGGDLFSLDTDSQINIIGLKNAVSDGLIILPLDYISLNGTVHTLSTEQHISDFYAAAFNRKFGLEISGRDLIVQINNAVDEAAINAISDDRT